MTIQYSTMFSNLGTWRGGVGGEADLLLVEKALPVSLVLQLLPCRFSPGMELCCFLSGSLSFLLECLGLGDLE